MATDCRWKRVIPMKVLLLLSLGLATNTATSFTVNGRRIIHPKDGILQRDDKSLVGISSSGPSSLLNIRGGSSLVAARRRMMSRILNNNENQNVLPSASKLDATIAAKGEQLVDDSDNNSSKTNKLRSFVAQRIDKPVVYRTSVSIILAAILGGIYMNNQVWFATNVASKLSAFSQRCNEGLIAQLDKLSNSGTKGLILYGFMFMIWELTLGITTPVETAAGMAFGVKYGILANAIGKTLGGVLAFVLGRYIFFDYVQSKMSQSEILQLIEDSVEETPVKVAVLLRLSPFPEPVKNFGASMLQPLRLYQYFLSLLLHGFPFTCLWTCLGAETSRVMRGATPSTTLKVLVSALPWFGVFTSSLIAWWIKGLRDAKQQKTLQDKP